MSLITVFPLSTFFRLFRQFIPLASTFKVKSEGSTLLFCQIQNGQVRSHYRSTEFFLNQIANASE